MGVFSKLKDIFYDEEYVDDDQNIKSLEKINKKEVEDQKPKIEEIKVVKEENISDIKEEKISSPSTERELFKREKTFNFTEFEDEELPQRKSVLDIQSRSNVKTQEDFEPSIPKTKVFKPSPVISPIYGILDKDYKKEEIGNNKTSEKKVINDTASPYDKVRRKAYGTLEDELEDTLNEINKLTAKDIKEEISQIDESVEKLETKTTKIEDLISKLEDTNSDLTIGQLDETDNNVSIGQLEDNVKLENFDEDIDKTMTDKTLEHDLFNLIDSMYDDKED